MVFPEIPPSHLHTSHPAGPLNRQKTESRITNLRPRSARLAPGCPAQTSTHPCLHAAPSGADRLVSTPQLARGPPAALGAPPGRGPSAAPVPLAAGLVPPLAPQSVALARLAPPPGLPDPSQLLAPMALKEARLANPRPASSAPVPAPTRLVASCEGLWWVVTAGGE
jgi:hypothetical protein